MAEPTHPQEPAEAAHEPVFEIGTAGEAKADAIFVGRSSSRVHQVLGSVAVRLVRHANRPIVVVP